MLINLEATDEKTMHALGHTLGQLIMAPIWCYFEGPLGAGKTTFIQGVLAGLGVHTQVTSPTFSLLEVYNIKSDFCLHLDLYRLPSADEIPYLGLDQYPRQQTIGLVEWPEAIVPFYPADVVFVIEFLHNGRRIQAVPKTPRGHQLLEKLATELGEQGICV